MPIPGPGLFDVTPSQRAKVIAGASPASSRSRIMAPDVIDLISSSPSPPKKQQEPPPSHCPPALEPQNDRRSKQPMLPQSNQRSRPAPFCLSDDFDMTDDNDDFLGVADSRSSKRPRLSASPPTTRTATTSRPSYKPASRPVQPPLRTITSERPNRPVFDPIEFTSSIEEDVLPATRQNDKSRDSNSHRPAQTTKKSAQPPHLSISSDLFVRSSPPPAYTRNTDNPPKKTAFDDFSDPFASSPALPPPPPCPSKPPDPKSRDQEFSDPFVSSPEPFIEQPPKPRAERRATSIDVTENRPTRHRNDWDPISSSAPEPLPRKSPPKPSVAAPTVISIDSDSQDGSDDDDEFPDIANIDFSKYRPRPRSPLRRSRCEIVSSKSRSRTANTTTKKTTEQRTREREARTAEKAVEKERKRQEKEQIKEAKAREKERAAALAEVNKIRTDKKVSTPEMIVLMPSNIDPGLKVQVETLLDGLNVEHTSWESPVGSAFKWRRKVTSRFNEDMGRWEPIPLQIRAENHALIILGAEEFVDLAINDSLDAHVNQTKIHFPGHEIIYILEGITAWMRKNRNIRNRQFASGVRSQAVSSDAAPARGRRRNNAASEEHISEDLIEDTMLRLQVEHDVLIHHTAAPLDTAQWIVAFTQHISTIPYKKQRDQATSTAGFCMESGQVRTGDDVRDTYVRMLQEIARVTAPIAYGIAAEFDSVSKLVDGLEKGGPGTLEGVRKSANKDGALSDRTVGQAVSKRIYKVFTGRDEMSTDV